MRRIGSYVKGQIYKNKTMKDNRRNLLINGKVVSMIILVLRLVQ